MTSRGCRLESTGRDAAHRGAPLVHASGPLRRVAPRLEAIARRELGLIRPGEKVFIVKDLAQPKRP